MIEDKKNRLWRLYILAVIILLIFLHWLGLFKGLGILIMDNVSSWQNNGFTFFTKLNYSFINYQESTNLKKENIELRKQIDELLYEKSLLNQDKLENENLRQILNFQKDKNFNNIVAKVIGKDLNRANVLIINRGKNQGIQEGYAVVIDNGIIIGKVIAVKDNLASILLITDKQSQLSVSTETMPQTIGLAQGEFGLSIKLNLIPQDLAIKEGDVVITSGLEQDIPKGLVLGKISRIISQENELFKSATINSSLNYNEITMVNIVIPQIYVND